MHNLIVSFEIDNYVSFDDLLTDDMVIWAQVIMRAILESKVSCETKLLLIMLSNPVDTWI